MALSDLKVIRRSNSHEILELIRAAGKISRAALSKKAKLTRKTISQIMADLIERKYISEVGKGVSSGGKPPILLELARDGAYAAGIDLANEGIIRGVLCDFSGGIVQRLELPCENRSDDILEKILRIALQFKKQVPARRLKGVGIAVSGIVDVEKNEVLFSSNLDIAGKNLAGELSKGLSLPVYLENNPRSSAWLELRQGKIQGVQNLLFLNTGTGVGAGLIFGGKIYYGSFMGSGEIGSVALTSEEFYGAPRSQDILEKRVNEAWLFTEAARLGLPGEMGALILEYQNGNEKVAALFRKHAQVLAYAAAFTANLLNPEVVILGGKVTAYGPKYFEEFRRVFEAHLLTPYVGKIRLAYSEFGLDGVALGGAALVLEKVIRLEI
ncbi:MAG: ROK family transcriptional regulator [Spirochaetia bacterium]|nr:ROK family transcriptional regulator [Spirochaetia bacterium]